ncbi:DUF3311 domain-containing protein [Halomonas dongshanensis]|uniref:DUF3311 domain-containing protein n=1 Tax=Halomonas dongshanensis TaxID=2890835 RepID=A0ABT2E947_9GAMM|nr:DUF3311 domain-containing protein [Halomonas dongshanensis]MCS2608093.1 DUF3311 domain-containing protein [Halomonas dongshanensis]
MNPTPKTPSKWILAYFTICALAMIWPGALIANRIEPFVLGLPFFVFWYVAWVFALFLGLLIAYQKDNKEARDE